MKKDIDILIDEISSKIRVNMFELMHENFDQEEDLIEVLNLTMSIILTLTANSFLHFEKINPDLKKMTTEILEKIKKLFIDITVIENANIQMIRKNY